MVDESRQFLRALAKFPPPSEISIEVIQTGIGANRVRASLEATLSLPPDALIVFGTAAGLDSSLQPGDTVFYREVAGQNGSVLGTSETLTDYLDTILMPLRPRRGNGVTVGVPVCSASEKAELQASTEGQCVDMESLTFADFAQQHEIPLAVLRVVVDPATQTIPSAALAGMHEDGRNRVWPTLFALLKNPKQLPSLLMLAAQYRRALQTLRRAAELICADIKLRSVTELATYFSKY